MPQLILAQPVVSKLNEQKINMKTVTVKQAEKNEINWKVTSDYCQIYSPLPFDIGDDVYFYWKTKVDLVLKKNFTGDKN